MLSVKAISVCQQLSMSEQPAFVRNQLCWVRTGRTSRFYPARVVADEDLNARQMWTGNPPYYSVIFFDTKDIHAGSAYHVRSLPNIKDWARGMKEGLNKKVPASDVLRALQFQEANADIAEKHETTVAMDIDQQLKQIEGASSSFKQQSEEGLVSSAQINENLTEVDRDVSLPPSKKRRASSVSRDPRKPRPESVACDKLEKSAVVVLQKGITPESTTDGKVALRKSYEPRKRLGQASRTTEEENVKPACVNVGLIGANEVSDEVMRVVLQQSGCRISALWDHNANECEQLLKRLSGDGYEGIEVASSMEDLCTKCDVVFCCMEQMVLLREERGEDGTAESLLENLLTVAGNAHVGIFLITFFSRILARAASLMLNEHAKRVSVVGVSVCGAVGRANIAFVSGNMSLYRKYGSAICSLAKKIINKGDEPAKALLCGIIYNRLMIGLVFEAFAWQAFAGEYGMRDEELMELLKESNLLDDFINIGVPGILDESPRRSLQQVVASTAQARWLNSAAMGTYAGSANSRAMVQTGVNIHQVLENAKKENFAEAVDDYLNEAMQETS
uniref:3-hydroxyacyl-CoA dehydrogenase n=1 Tax=Ascaris lumbricoides TaxID=6252 RepID=A0A0M3I2P9_ASCLU